MSYTELQSGKIKVVGKMTPTEVDDYMKNVVEQELPEQYKEIIQKGFPCWSNGWLEIFNDNMWKQGMYIYKNDTLFKVFEIKDHECDGYFCEVNKTGDDEYRFITQYYNGGTCLSEILEEKCENLK